MSIAAEEVPFIIAADAGGTHTRVACFGLDGALLGFARGKGGSPFHNADAAGNVAETTVRALNDAGLDAADAICLVSGLAGISRPGSNQGDGNNDWADEFFGVPSLDCERIILNDAVVAHRGALLGRPGVMVVAGTGSMIIAMNEDGAEVESGQFEHYAGAARHLAFEAVQQILVGADGPADRDFVDAVLDYWSAPDVPGLRRTLLGLGSTEPMEVRHRYGRLAPEVTAAADTSPLADRALRHLAEKTARGIQLLAPLVGQSPVSVATTGGLATTPAFTSRLNDALRESPLIPTMLVPAELDALRGAALIAYQHAGSDIRDQKLIARLRQSQVAAA
ncbi:BadF/BadG/BcrA/BcrD ATPase family protein [Rathayibacter sp. KR2-224]|uniref:BadF/BadG/BcrA/BcrD ATPase family protein n=1 Tax=Rathayibacter sp. KR2-224 TaxID=3400913 RepID=UPI003C0D8CE7